MHWENKIFANKVNFTHSFGQGICVVVVVNNALK